MANKIETAIIQKVLQESLHLSAQEMTSIIEKMRSLNDKQKIEESASDNKVKGKKVPYVLIDSDNSTEDAFLVYVVKAKDGMSEQELVSRISSAAFDFNDAQKKVSRRVNGIFEAISQVKSKYFKQYGISVLDKELRQAFVLDSEFGERFFEEESESEAKNDVDIKEVNTELVSNLDEKTIDGSSNGSMPDQSNSSEDNNNE